MNKQIQQVEQFNDAFNQEYSKNIPTLISKEESILRHKLMQEENNEYLDAVENNNLVEVADALGDQLYILLGTIIKHGMQSVITKAFDLIHESNMSKLGEDGNPILREDGKILKGPNYQKVDLTPLFNKECHTQNITSKKV